MEENFLSNTLFNNFLKNNIKTNNFDIYNDFNIKNSQLKKNNISNSNKRNDNHQYKQINKNQLIKLIRTYHDRSKTELIEELYEYLVSEINNNMWGEFSVNIEELNEFIFQSLLKKLKLIDNLKKFSIITQDFITEERFNEISADNLEENENLNLTYDSNQNKITVEKIYDEMVYYSQNYTYKKYLNSIIDLFKKDFSEEDFKKIQKLLLN